MVVDENGKLHTLFAPHVPKKALAGTNDVLPFLSAQKNDKAFPFNDTTAKSGRGELTLKFSNSANSKKGKLILGLKNTYWLDYMYGKMTEGIGDYYPTFASYKAQDLLKILIDGQGSNRYCCRLV